jgi:O-antigen ligase
MELASEGARIRIVRGKRSKYSLSRSSVGALSICDIALVGLLLCILIFGGASRSDVLSGVFIRPIAVIGISIILLNNFQSDKAMSFWKWLGAAWAVYIACQLVPLPPSIFFSLPGHFQFEISANDSGTANIWRPMSVVPWATWNSLFALVVPAFGLLFGLRYRSYLDKILPIFIFVICMINLVIGAAQLISDYNSSLYFFDITNRQSVTGLFANRNHCAALFCIAICFAMPSLKALDIHLKMKNSQYFALLIFYMLTYCIAAILTGSRAGTAFSVILVVVFTSMYTWQYRAMFVHNIKPMIMILCIFGLICVIAVLLYLYFPIDRWRGLSEFKDGRADIFPQAVAMTWSYFPFGGGAGTFPYVYFSLEPTLQMDLTYINHAHNDILESIFEIGVLAILIIAAGSIRIIHIVFAAYTIRKTSIYNYFIFNYVTSVFVLFFWSFVDYPMRTPTLALVGVLSLTAAESAFTRMTVRASGKSGLDMLSAADKEGASN